MCSLTLYNFYYFKYVILLVSLFMYVLLFCGFYIFYVSVSAILCVSILYLCGIYKFNIRKSGKTSYISGKLWLHVCYIWFLNAGLYKSFKMFIVLSLKCFNTLSLFSSFFLLQSTHIVAVLSTIWGCSMLYLLSMLLSIFWLIVTLLHSFHFNLYISLPLYLLWLSINSFILFLINLLLFFLVKYVHHTS